MSHIWTFLVTDCLSANIWLHTFMSTLMNFKTTTTTELLLTNATYPTSTFTVGQANAVGPTLTVGSFFILYVYIRSSCSAHVYISDHTSFRTGIWRTSAGSVSRTMTLSSVAPTCQTRSRLSKCSGRKHTCPSFTRSAVCITRWYTTQNRRALWQH